MANVNYVYNLTVSQLRNTTVGTNNRSHGYPVVATDSIRIATVYITSTYGAATAQDQADINITTHGDLA